MLRRHVRVGRRKYAGFARIQMNRYADIRRRQYLFAVSLLLLIYLFLISFLMPEVCTIMMRGLIIEEDILHTNEKFYARDKRLQKPDANNARLMPKRYNILFQPRVIDACAIYATARSTAIIVAL